MSIGSSNLRAYRVEVRGMGEAKAISLEDIRRYGGKHAVLVDGEIVAASDNPAEAYREALKEILS